MIENLAEPVAAVLLLLGGLASLIGAAGLWRLPDLYLRMHAASKAGVLGTGLILIGAAVGFDSTAITLRLLVAVGFIVLTAPVAAHAIGRAAWRAGIPLARGAVVDQSPTPRAAPPAPPQAPRQAVDKTGG